MTGEEIAILKRAIKTYGEESQQDMMIEEMSELTKAILKLRRAMKGKDYPYTEIVDVREEMADVQIMLDQMYIMFGLPEREREIKINRLEKRLEKRLQEEKTMNEWHLSEVVRIVTDCEKIQKSHESSFTKEMAKVNAYNEIKEILGIEVADEDSEETAD